MKEIDEDTQKMERPPFHSQSSLEKRNKAGRITLPDIKIYNKAVVIKTVRDWPKNRHRRENPEISPCICSQLILNRGTKILHWRKDRLFNKQCSENWIFTCRRLTLDPYLSPYTKMNLKWIKDLSVILETMIYQQMRRRNTSRQQYNKQLF